MAVLVIILAAVCCLSVELITGKVAYGWGALGLALTGLALLAAALLSTRRRVPDSSDSDAAATEEIPASADNAGTDDTETSGAAADTVNGPATGTSGASTNLGTTPARETEPIMSKSAHGAASKTATVEPDEATSAGESEFSESRPEAGQAHGPTVSELGGPVIEVVQVIPGRRRFHREGCKLLTGRDTEQLGLDEAQDEGFTACTVCVPHREALLIDGS
jgi:hypothetical protein